jgi:hypothetical protein
MYPQNKTPCVMISLSSIVTKGTCSFKKRKKEKKNIWAHEGPSIEKNCTHVGPRKK